MSDQTQQYPVSGAGLGLRFARVTWRGTQGESSWQGNCTGNLQYTRLSDSAVPLWRAAFGLRPCAA